MRKSLIRNLPAYLKGEIFVFLSLVGIFFCFVSLVFNWTVIAEKIIIVVYLLLWGAIVEFSLRDLVKGGNSERKKNP